MQKLLAIAAMTAALASSALAENEFRHVVLFKFKPEATEVQVKEIEKAFAALPSKIDAVTGYEWGKSESVEGLNDGFTHCFLVTFRDKKGRETYLPHAEHKKFVELALPRIEKVLVVDYWTP